MGYKKVLFFLFFLAAAISPFFILPAILPIRQISCVSQFGPCNQSLKKSMEKIVAEQKSLSKTKKALKSLLANDVLVDEFHLQFKLADRLEATILERKPRFALGNEKTKILALVDSSGYVILFQDSSSLPKLIVPFSLPNLGEKVDEATLFGLETLDEAFSFYQVQTAKLADNGLVIELPLGPKVIFPLEGERAVLFGSLRLILAKLNRDTQDSRIENTTKVREIDLRFNNPVVK